MKNLALPVALALLLTAVLSFADQTQIGLQTLLKTSPKANPVDGSLHLIGMQGSTIKQLSYSSVRPPIATASVPGIVAVGIGLSIDANGKLNNTGIAGVASFKGRGGAVEPASGDYSIDQIAGTATVARTGSYLDLGSKPAIPAAQIPADWNQATSTAPDYIRNKPVIPSLLSQLAGDATHRTVTDGQVSQWNNNSSPIQSVFGRTGAVTAQPGDYSAVDVGADPLGSATSVQANLNTHTGRTDNPHTVTKAQVGLANVDNTSDANKPVSNATQTALNAKESTANKGAINGYPSLNGAGVVPIAQLPVGTTGTTVAIGNDNRFYDARTPTAHKASHATGGSDALAPSDIGALPVNNPTATGTLTAPSFTSNAADGGHYVDCSNSGAMTNTGWGTTEEGRWCYDKTLHKFRYWNGSALADLAGTGGGTWGGITGTLANQTDLQTALNGKQASLGYTPLNPANNLSDVGSAATARGNLGAAPLASPAFTGTPTAPTATAGTNNTQVATTAFVTAAVASAGGGTGTIGGSTGSTDNAVLSASGTGGSTLKPTGVTIDPTTGTITTPQSATNPDSLTLRQKQGLTGTVTTTIDNTGSFTPYTNVWPQTQPSGLLKMVAGVFGGAVSGTDYAPATSGSSPLKGNGAGGFSLSSANDISGLWSGTKDSAHCLAGDGTMQPIGGGSSDAATIQTYAVDSAAPSDNDIWQYSTSSAKWLHVTPATLKSSLGLPAFPTGTIVGTTDAQTMSNKTFTAPIITNNEVDGHASITLTAAQVSNTIVYNAGMSAADVALTFPTAAAGYSAMFVVGTAQANKWGVRAGATDKIYILNADGTITAGSDNGYARMTNAQIGQSFACWTFKTDAYDWMCKAVAIGTSTFAAN